MNPTHNNKGYSLIFTLIVLISVLIGDARRGSDDDVALDARPEATSITATIQESLSQPVSAPEISAIAALVKYIDAPEPTLSLNPNQQWPVASLTKLMTAVVAIENILEEAQILVSVNAVATEGAAGNLLVGETYSRAQLLGALLKFSSNDAAVALAEYLGREKFLELMNGKVVALGMYNTRYFDPSGLSPLNQSMVSDLEKLVLYIFYQHPEIFSITREQDGNSHPFVKWANFIGGKTGFIDEANGNLISLFNYSPRSRGGEAGQGRPLLIVVLGSEDRAKDTEALYSFHAK